MTPAATLPRQVKVPSRTHAGVFYNVTRAIDGTFLCSCPASYYSLDCWHVNKVKEDTMTNEQTSTALVPIQLAQRNALVPTEREMVGITRAAKLALSGAVALPPELNTPEKVATVMLYGLELGLMPFTAIRHLSIIKGRVSPSTEVMAGLYLKYEPAGSIRIVSIDDGQCTMRIIRPSRKIDETYQVTWDEIKQAGLARDNNLAYPRDRMRYHATKRLLRVYAPDIINMLEGPVITPEDDDEEEMPLTNEGDEEAPVWREEAPVPPQQRAAAAPPQSPTQNAPASQRAAVTPETPALPVLKAQIQKKLDDIAGSWDGATAQALGGELLNRWPDMRPLGNSKTVNLAKLTKEQANDVNIWLGHKMGGPPVEEEPAPCEHPYAALIKEDDGSTTCGACGVSLGLGAEDE